MAKLKEPLREFKKNEVPFKFWDYNIHPITGWRMNKYSAAVMRERRLNREKERMNL